MYIWECCVDCGNGFNVNIIVYQPGSVVSDAEMVSSAKYNFFYVKIIIYQSGSVVSMRKWSAPQNVFFLCECDCISFLESWVGCGDGPLRTI